MMSQSRDVGVIQSASASSRGAGTRVDPPLKPTPKGRRLETLGLFLLAAGLLLRVVYVVHALVNSDEPQHLHVIWGWLHGLVQYRDVFDNHTPLFHLLFVPALEAVGERAGAVVWMRFGMLPLYAAVLAAVFSLGRELWSRSVGIWAAVFTGLLPPFSNCAVEFRPDLLWALVWLLALLALLRRPATAGRGWLGGLLLGVSAGVSLKTTLLLLALVTGTGIALVTTRAATSGWKQHLAFAAAVVLGLAVVPAAAILGFAALGAQREFFYGVIQHNLIPGGVRPQGFHLPLPLLPVAIGLIFLLSRGVLDPSAPGPVRIRRAVTFWTAASAYVGFHTVWPVVTVQDELPLYPLIMLLAAALAADEQGSPLFRYLRARRLPLRAEMLRPAALGFAALELFVLAKHVPWRDETREHREQVLSVLRLTRDSDYVLDPKGESIYRRRPVYYVYETLTQRRSALGLLPEDIPKRLAETGTCVTTQDLGRFPRRAREFIRRNYLRVGCVRVAGKLLSEAPASSPVSFEVEVPARYAVLSDGAPAAGLLDGAHASPRFLKRGRHSFTPARPGGELKLAWARAVERGFAF